MYLNYYTTKPENSQQAETRRSQAQAKKWVEYKQKSSQRLVGEGAFLERSQCSWKVHSRTTDQVLKENQIDVSRPGATTEFTGIRRTARAY